MDGDVSRHVICTSNATLLWCSLTQVPFALLTYVCWLRAIGQLVINVVAGEWSNFPLIRHGLLFGKGKYFHTEIFVHLIAFAPLAIFL